MEAYYEREVVMNENCNLLTEVIRKGNTLQQSSILERSS